MGLVHKNFKTATIIYLRIKMKTWILRAEEWKISKKNGTYITQKYNIWKEIFTGHAAYQVRLLNMKTQQKEVRKIKHREEKKVKSEQSLSDPGTMLSIWELKKKFFLINNNQAFNKFDESNKFKYKKLIKSWTE